MKEKQTYVHYEKWEDWINGMWRRCEKEEEERLLKIAIEFTGDHLRYGEAMKEVVTEWKNTMLNSLTNVSINRRAFLGHCAVSYKLNIPEYITRMAWKELTDMQRTLADMAAQRVIDRYIIEHGRKNKRVHTNMGKQMLLEWDS